MPVIAGGAQISVLQGGLACAVVADQENWRLPVQDSGFIFDLVSRVFVKYKA
ncbi:hypothetical protein LZ683_16635 [Comamonas testosteroni]|uniref:hypothetical protein n=1 Tax=Comamonas testosteroni TaxID=285 RepID=UPI0023AB3C38|nr:hypothetical protein [Comamonas testosteroni]WEE75783.1 hypothetical protein LZ683_16635 [Comamonas testosteroni]